MDGERRDQCCQAERERESRARCSWRRFHDANGLEHDGFDRKRTPEEVFRFAGKRYASAADAVNQCRRDDRIVAGLV